MVACGAGNFAFYSNTAARHSVKERAFARIWAADNGDKREAGHDGERYAGSFAYNKKTVPRPVGLLRAKKCVFYAKRGVIPSSRWLKGTCVGIADPFAQTGTIPPRGIS